MTNKEPLIPANELMNFATQEGLPNLLVTPALTEALDDAANTVRIRSTILACQQEMQFLQQIMAPLVSDESALEKIAGRMKELRELANQTVFSLYPETPSVDIEMNPPGITREEQNILTAAVEYSDFDLLNPEKLSFLRHFSPEALYRLQLQAMDNLISWWDKEELCSQPSASMQQEPPSLRNELANQRLIQLKTKRDQIIQAFSENHPELFNDQ